MKVLVLNNAVPFGRGGAEELADNLVAQLNATKGITSELVRLPFSWTPSERLIEEMLIARQIRIENTDRVIALKFPAYLAPHANKALWLLHQFRQAYDLGEVGQGLADDGREGEIKRAIRTADTAAFAACRAIFTNSPVTRDRLRRFNGVEGEVLYPPVNDAELFTGGEAGGYVFAGGRLGEGKRQHLLVEAMAQVKTPGRLVVAGPPETPAYADALRRRVAELGLEDRVELAFGFHPRARIAQWVNGSTACAYLPYDEDSLGYVTMEAFAAAKPVLTTDDAGGLLEIVSAETGAVVAPDPSALAAALDALLVDPAAAAAKGRAARDALVSRRLTWEATLARLLG